MKYTLVYPPHAAEELELAIGWSFEHHVTTAAEWSTKLLDTIGSLATDPHRHGLAREDSQFDATIRQLLFGRAKSIYRILYTVEGNTVWILHIRRPGPLLLS